MLYKCCNPLIIYVVLFLCIEYFNEVFLNYIYVGLLKFQSMFELLILLTIILFRIGERWN